MKENTYPGNMISIYLVRKDIASLFTSSFVEKYLKEHGITYTNNPLAADILLTMSGSLRSFKLLRRLLFFKKSMTWTNEPRHDYTVANFKTPRHTAMNVYSGDVFLHNLHFLGSYHSDFSIDLGLDIHHPPTKQLTISELGNKQGFCVGVFAYREPHGAQWLVNGEDIDLNGPRQELVRFFNAHGKADIVGGNWPATVKVLESSGYESGNETWWQSKLSLLKNYRFNICFENTAYPYYCTEKIWHAIAAGCLPIYYGKGTAIYETFPEGSFIDAADFATPQDLLTFLEALTPEEHVARYNQCLAVMHRASAQRVANSHLKTDVLDAFIQNARALAEA